MKRRDGEPEPGAPHVHAASRWPADAFRARVRAALARPEDGALATRFFAPLVIALVVHADEDDDAIVGAVLETLDALTHIGMPRGRAYVLLAGEGAPALAVVRVPQLRVALGVPVLVHEPARAGFAAGRLPDGSALVLDDELREAEAIVTLSSTGNGPAGAWRAASLLCPGACSDETRTAFASACARDGQGSQWQLVRAAEREAPIDLAVWWDDEGIVTAASGRWALAALAGTAGHAGA